MKNFSCPECRPPCPLADLPLQEMRAWEGSIRAVSFIAHQTIFEQGDSQNGCYLVCAGTAILRARAANGRQLVIGIVEPWNMLGVGGFLGQRRHELSAQALSEIRAHHLTRAICERLVQEPSLLASRLLAVMARQIKQVRRLSQLFASRASVRERLAALILELGQQSQGVRQIELKLSCELLGEMLDSHRSTVNMRLIELRGRGLIEKTAGRIVILDEVGLQKLAGNVF